MNHRLSIPGAIAQPGTPTRWLNLFLHVPEEEIVGCTSAEIAEIEAAAGQSIPTAYRQWMLEAGRIVGSGHVDDHFQRSYMTYPYVKNIKNVVLEVIDRPDSDKSLLERAFPFYNWEVYRICLLDLSQPREDPPVLVLDEHTGRADWQFRSFSQFIAWEIFTLADALELQRRRNASVSPRGDRRSPL